MIHPPSTPDWTTCAQAFGELPGPQVGIGPVAAALQAAADLCRAGDWGAALTRLDQALAQHPATAEVLLERGEILFKLNRSEEGLAAWREARSLLPAPLLPPSPATLWQAACAWRAQELLFRPFWQVLIKLAEALVGAHRFDVALAAWEAAFALAPEDPVVHKRLTAAFLFCGQVAEADRIFQARVDHHRSQGQHPPVDIQGLRFLRDFTTHIGHLGFLDLYVKAGLLGLRGPGTPVVLCGRKPVANRAYLAQWEGYLPRIIADVDTYAQLEPLVDALEDHTHGWEDAQGRLEIRHDWRDYVRVQRQWVQEGRPPLLALDEGQRAAGRALLRTLGVPEGAWFVGFHVREDVWDRGRNAALAPYLPALEAITQAGGWVIRMGDARMTPMPPLPGVVDYAHTPHKSEAMDVFLWAEGRFFLGTQSGPCQVPPTFGRPCVLTNWSPLLFPVIYEDDLCLPKRYWSKPEARFLGIRELLATGIGSATSAGHLAALGIDLLENSPEEIQEAVVEMMARLEGTLPDAPEDARLQAAWRDCYAATSGTNGRLGRAWAARHAQLLA